ncbi:hypothetical protein MJH12_02490 [bacterium]|nr:hypothetical protein [bacterium]
MKTNFKETPRTFGVKGHKIHDMGSLELEDGEMVTFRTKSNKECDFVAKDWGFYLGPSLNSRLKQEGFKTALVLNEQGQIYINAVDVEKMDLFLQYLKTNQNNTVLCWLDEWIPNK